MAVKKGFIRGVFVYLCFLSMASHGEIYRWVDENGKVHFSDKPTKDSDKIEIKPQESLTSGDDRKRIQANKEWFEKRRAEREEEQRKEEKAQARAHKSGKKARDACANVRLRLKKKQIELENRKRAGIRVKTENWYKSKIEVLTYEVSQKC